MNSQLFCMVLGPTVIQLNGATVHLGGPTQRRTLTLLLDLRSSRPFGATLIATPAA